MKLSEILIPSKTIEVPKYFYRGSGMAMRSAFFTKVWRSPNPDIPSEINDLFIQDKITHLYGLSYNTPFKISRTYQGLSNWGFGVYFATSLEWAKRYGSNITIVEIEPQSVLAIKSDDFANERPNTTGGELRKRLTVATNGSGMRDEAAVMSSIVKTIKRKAKALYVEVEPGHGQICVFSKSAIHPRFYFELKK